MELDVLYFRSGRLPPDVRKRSVSDQQAAAAYRALRRELRSEKNLKNVLHTLVPIHPRDITAVQHRVLHLRLLIWQTA